MQPLMTSAASTNFPAAVALVLREHVKLPVDAPVLMSVSGGSDSVALFRVLVELSGSNNWNLSAVHFNHGLRQEAEEEEEFVRALSERHGVPLHVRRLGKGELGSVGVQERARAWRRAESLAILSDLTRCPEASDGASPHGAVMLGHHADDNVETVLLKALRGCHLSNLHGMRYQSGAFVRPLLGLRKQDILSYLHAIGQEWKEDPSNAEHKYKRNSVRLRLLPLLDELAEGALHARIAAIEDQSAQLHEWLRQAREAYLRSDEYWTADETGSDEADETGSDEAGAGALGRGGGGVQGLSVSGLLEQVPMLQDELLHALVRSATTRAAAAADDDRSLARETLGYKQLRRVRAQLARPSLEWTLDLSSTCTMRRVGNLLTVAPATKRDLGGDLGGNLGGDLGGDLGGASSATGQWATAVTEVDTGVDATGRPSRLTISHPPEWRVAVRRVEIAGDRAAGADADARPALDGGDVGGASEAREGREAEADDRAPIGECVVLHNLPAGSALEVRTPQPGDKFHPTWRDSPVSLVAFLRGQRVPLESRRSVRLVCAAGGHEVLAVYPHHVAARVSAPRVDQLAAAVPTAAVFKLCIKS